MPSKKRQASSPTPVAKILQSTPDPTFRTNPPSIDETGNVRRATTFPVNAGPSSYQKRPSVPYVPSISAQVVPPNRDLSASHIPLDAYTPSSSETTHMQSPDSQGSGGLGSHVLAQQPYNANGLPDFSTMMFPSGDPFAYPTQPMMPLEDQQFTKSTPPFSTADSENMYGFTPASSGAPYDNTGAQLFGPLPPYMLQGQQYGTGPQSMGPRMELDGPDGEAGMIAMNGRIGGWPPQQQVKTPGVNLDDIFGEEWKAGWSDQGFVQ